MSDTSLAPLDPPASVTREEGDFASRALPEGKLLWHYTEFGGLKGMLDGTLWASSLPYLNDTQEFHYGVTAVLEVVSGGLFGTGSHMQEIRRRLRDFLERQYTATDVFVASLSTAEDDLSQWRAYAGRGPGFSVGFWPKKLELQASKYLFSMHGVQYEDDAIEADVRAELAEIIAAANQDLRTVTEPTFAVGFVERWTHALVTQVMLLPPRYKHPKFQAEGEWRLTRRMPRIDSKPQLVRQFRQSGSLVVPYVEIPLHTLPSAKEVYNDGARADSPIAAVKIGPSPHPAELKHAIEEMVSRKGLTLVEVTSSEVPFRNW